MKVCLGTQNNVLGNQKRFKCEKNKKGDAKDIKINRMNRYHLDKDIPRRWNI